MNPKNTLTNREWMDQVVKKDEISKYYTNNKNFIESNNLGTILEEKYNTSTESIRKILKKSLAIETLSLKDLATLMQIEDKDMWDEMFEVARQIKVKVYNNRIVTFAPIYMSNLCVNNCEYCGFKKE
ncbi:MAG: [FeFe] hydrogenase H-cluster radical SAM maturase HydG, partial [Caldisericia bacterium]|nr:[FeFe] hydrogenase H-cluster radical SAM maturase HydG [Caldisericia bacterium]